MAAGRISDVELDRLKAADDFVGRVARMVPDLKREGREYRGTCPEHGGRSFRVIPAKHFAHCHGCAKHWDPISWIMGFDGLEFLEAVRALGGEVDRGVDPEALAAWQRAEEQRARQAERALETKPAIAGRLWREAAPIDGTPAERYLEGRGLVGPFPASLRFHSALKAHWTEGEGDAERSRSTRLPALLAAVQAPGGPLLTIHRIYLEELAGGDVVKASIMPAGQVKKLHGSPGAGAVRLTPSSYQVPDLAIAEGIETALAVREALAAIGQAPAVWSAISAGQLVRLGFPAAWRPARIQIFADHDPKGAGARMARAAAERFRRMGIRAAWRMPPTAGIDWLDTLTDEKRSKGAA